MPVTPITRQAIWSTLLDAGRLYYYYAALSSKYNKEKSILTILLLLATALGIVAAATGSPLLAPVGPSLMLLVLLYERNFRVRERLALSDLLFTLHQRSLQDWEGLWQSAHAGSMDEAEAVAEKKRLLREHETRVSGLDARLELGGEGIPALNQRATEDSHKLVLSRYAVV